MKLFLLQLLSRRFGRRPVIRNSAGEVVPAVGYFAPGDFSLLRPVSRLFGTDRGLPVDRVYIERFLAENKVAVQGRVLEIGDRSYTQRFGQNRVAQSDVLHATDKGDGIITGDLVSGNNIPKNAYDCMIITQTFHVIYDIKRAIQTTYDALRPGGVLLATLPGISQVARNDMNAWGDYWRVTDRAAHNLFCEFFGHSNVTVRAYGNVRTACSFLQGLAAHEVPDEAYAIDDEDFPVIVTVKAIKNVPSNV